LAWRWGIEGAVVAMSISQLTATALSLRATIQNCRDHGIPLTTVGIWQERAVLWRYAIPSLAGGAMSGPAATLSRALVAQIPGGVTALGGFAAAVRWRDIVLFIPGAVRQITLPILSRLRGGNDRQRYVKALWANIGVNAGIALIGSLPIVMMSPWILALYGSEFRRDWDLMAILVGSSVFQAVKDVLARVVASMGKMWWSVWMAIVWSAVTLGGTYLLVPRYGIRGYVWIVVVASVVNMAMYAVAAVALIGRWDRLSEAKIETPHD
jgi:O-antigen/teichoic acid export membrane protein